MRPARRARGAGTTSTVRLLQVAAVGVALVALVGCGGGDGTTAPSSSTAVATSSTSIPSDCPAETVAPERLVPQVVAQVPHDPTAFTEGLALHDGVLYESTGLVGHSSLREVDPATGAVRRERPLDARLFGEGLAVGVHDELVQLTWKDRIALVWDRTDLRRTGELSYQGEGWGLTTLDDGTFVMSDGTSRLTERDPNDFRVLRTWTVSRADGPTDQLNELEWDGTHLWANRWQTDEIVRIDPRCHRVDAVVDASSLTGAARSRAGSARFDVLNGIAHVPGTDRFLVTGKLWPVMFDVRFVPA